MAADQQPIRSQTLPGARTAGRLTAIFVQGLIALLPLAVTFAILWWLGLTAERILGGAIRWALPDEWYVRGMGIAAGVIVIFLVGVLMNIYGVPKLIHLGEQFIGRIPLVKTVYGAVRDLLGFFSQPGGDRAVSKVVIVTFGTSDVRAVGLLTREGFDDLPQGLGGEGYVVVFFPYSYQVGGFTMILPRTSVQPLDMRLEDAMRFIVTAGAKAGETPSPQDHSDSAENVGATVRE
jgi:uncharacterized membrane protein